MKTLEVQAKQSKKDQSIIGQHVQTLTLVIYQVTFGEAHVKAPSAQLTPSFPKFQFFEPSKLECKPKTQQQSDIPESEVKGSNWSPRKIQRRGIHILSPLGGAQASKDEQPTRLIGHPTHE